MTVVAVDVVFVDEVFVIVSVEVFVEVFRSSTAAAGLALALCSSSICCMAVKYLFRSRGTSHRDRSYFAGNRCRTRPGLLQWPQTRRLCTSLSARSRPAAQASGFVGFI